MICNNKNYHHLFIIIFINVHSSNSWLSDHLDNQFFFRLFFPFFKIMRQFLPFAAKWTITEGELIALKDSANGCLVSTFATTSAGIQYRLQIYPNGNRKQNRGKVFVFLVVKLGNMKELKAICTIKVESADNYSREIDHIFKESRGWGKCFCSTAEFFDNQKGFILDGKMELKVDGIFVFGKDNDLVVMYSSNLGLDLCTNEESKDFMIIVEGKAIMVHRIILAVQSPLFDEMFKSNSKEVRNNQFTITDFSFNIVQRAMIRIYECDFEDNKMDDDDTTSLIKFYDKFNFPSLKDELTNIHNKKGIPKFDENYDVVNNCSNINTKCAGFPDIGKKLWAREESKDYKIIVDGKVIMVHKFILAAKSPKFAEIFRSKSAESIKSQIEISGFSFVDVEAAIKTIYGTSDPTNPDSADVYYFILLLSFFSTYDFPNLKNDIELILLGRYLSAATVCHLTNCGIITNSKMLHEKCLEFLMAAYASNTPLFDIANLDKNVALKIIQNAGHRVDDKDAALKILQEYLYHIVYTRKDNASIMPVLK